MFRLSYDNFRDEIAAIAKTRQRNADGTITPTGVKIVPYRPRVEDPETDKIMSMEKYGVDKHFKAHKGVPPPLVFKHTVTENMARRIIMRLSEEFHVTVDMDDTNTTLTFQTLETTSKSLP